MPDHSILGVLKNSTSIIWFIVRVELGLLTRVEVELNQFDIKLLNANRRKYDYLGVVYLDY